MRIQTELTSDTAQVEDRFEATTIVDLYEGNRVLIPAGSVMRGLVTSVESCLAHRSQGEPDGGVQSDYGQRPQLPDARNGHRSD